MRYGYGSSGFGFGFQLTPWVKRLLIANVAIFFVFFLLPRGLDEYFALWPRNLIDRPWTPLTYMFIHAGGWHLFFNMLILFFFGPPLENHWGSKEFIRYYIICGLGAAAFSLIFAWNAGVVGASGAIFGIMLAFALNWPDSPIYIWGIFPVKAKWLVLFMGFMALFAAVGGSADGIAHFAHLGGLVTGLIYLKLDFRSSARLERWKKALSRPRLTVVTTSDAPPVEKRQARRDREEERLLDEVDRVLDKISSSGLASLSPAERKLLDEVSRRYRKN